MLLLLKPADLSLQLKTGLLTNLPYLGTSAKQYIPKRNVAGDYSGNINHFNAVNVDNCYWSGDEEDDEEDDEAGSGIEHVISHSAHYGSNFRCLYRFRSKFGPSLDGPVFSERRVHRTDQYH